MLRWEYEDVRKFFQQSPLALGRVAQIAGKKPTLMQIDIIQKSETLGTTLRPSVASELRHFVAHNSMDESFQMLITRIMWHVTLTSFNSFRIAPCAASPDF